MLGKYLKTIFWGISVFSVLWFYTAFVKPAFIGIFHRKGKNIAVGISAAVSAFLFIAGLVSIIFLVEHYRFMR